MDNGSGRQDSEQQILEQGNGAKARTAVTPLFGVWAKSLLLLLTVLLVAGIVWTVKTGDAMEALPFLHRTGPGLGKAKTIVDETPWSTVRAIAALAVTQEEKGYAHDAERLADHDVDQAFAAALRTASLRMRTLSGEALAKQKRVTELEQTVATDEQALKDATAKSATGDDVDVATAQLGLDKDELEDARDELATASGDQRGEIQQELLAREAEMKKFDSGGDTAEVALISVSRYRTLAGLIGAWQRQQQRLALLRQAKATTEENAAKHVAERDAMTAEVKKPAATDNDEASTWVAGMKRLSLERQLMSIHNDRAETEMRLAVVYDRWAAQVLLQHRIVQHLVLVQLLWIAVILILAILLNAAVRRFSERESLDQRRSRTLSRIFRLAIQLVALISILLVIFGRPGQISTVIGLTTAGLTVALQDFILAFVGWFILMGRSGIGVGDVIEIDGVAGEVVEIGLFRTTLLETGNWTAKGHPTGRRVAFNNKYAISGKFFNFSTQGQWMWDELTVNVAEDEETYAKIERVQELVTKATKQDAAEAEAEWRKASAHHGLSHFTAEPAVNVRPAGSGVDLVVRYVTRASGRFEQKNKLYQCVIEAVHAKPEASAGGDATTA